MRSQPELEMPVKKAGPWSYEGDSAPEHWASLQREFAVCGSGVRQSPVDLSDAIEVDLAPINFKQQPGPFRVQDNGRSIKVIASPGQFMELMGRRFELQEIEFHRPGEGRMNGKAFEMSAHLLHKDSSGKFAVLAVMLEQGAEQPLVQQVLNNLPLEKGDPAMANGLLDLKALMPASNAHYLYMGSLTTPPCTEGVLWAVMKQAATVSAAQLAIFDRLYPANARPVQSSNGRLIKVSR